MCTEPEAGRSFTFSVIMRLTHCFPVSGNVHFSMILCAFPCFKEQQENISNTIQGVTPASNWCDYRKTRNDQRYWLLSTDYSQAFAQSSSPLSQVSFHTWNNIGRTPTSDQIHKSFIRKPCSTDEYSQASVLVLPNVQFQVSYSHFSFPKNSPLTNNCTYLPRVGSIPGKWTWNPVSF